MVTGAFQSARSGTNGAIATPESTGPSASCIDILTSASALPPNPMACWIPSWRLTATIPTCLSYVD